MITLAISELKMLARNRTVAIMTLAMPLILGAMLYLMPGTRNGSGPGPAPQGFAQTLIPLVAGLGTYLAGTSTLASRRQALVLKRLRMTVLSPARILAGILVPIALVNACQLFAILAVVDLLSPRGDAGLAWLAVAIVVAELLFAALALLTAVYTPSAEHAQYTTLPVLLVVIGAATWVAATGPANTDGGMTGLIQLALPGGGLATMAGVDWHSTAAAAPGVAGMAATLAWTALAAFVALRLFAWDPRSPARRRIAG
ncbi:MAG: hypothetical protein LBK95_04395 [Bifidobacteriaceae bacterium]|jgi:ABC-2 type transport system permease protein|nr:hypothetical protein [Bifidobacteriaceae bacterium]